MRSNVITKHCCVILCLLMTTFKNAVGAIGKDRLSKPCPAGFYRSKFLFGNCAVCPQLIYCKDQQHGDDQRCKDACAGKNVLSTTPTMTPSTILDRQEPTIRSVVTEKPKSTRPKTENLQKSSSKIFSEVSSERKAGKEITPSGATNRHESSDRNIIIIGVSCTVAALFIILLGFLIKQYKSQPYPPANQSHVVVYTTEANSNASSQIASNVQQGEVDEENSWHFPTSLSRSVLDNLNETPL